MLIIKDNFIDLLGAMYDEFVDVIPIIGNIKTIYDKYTERVEEKRIKEILERIKENKEIFSNTVLYNYEYINTSTLMIEAALVSRKQKRFEEILNMFENFTVDYINAKDNDDRDLKSDMYEFYLKRMSALEDFHIRMLQELHIKRHVFCIGAESKEVEKEMISATEIPFGKHSQDDYKFFVDEMCRNLGVNKRNIDDQLNYLTSTGFCKRIEGVSSIDNKMTHVFVTTSLYEDFLEKIERPALP